jgi:cell wall-associated NlpC family hydrolase
MPITPTRTLLAFCLCCNLSALAAPPSDFPASADLAMPAAAQSLVDRLAQVGGTVTDQAGALVSNAMEFLGVPYRRGGSDALHGFDCSGFVRTVYEQTLGLVLPRNASAQAAATEKVDKADLQPGDLVFFNTMRHAFSHVGIYLGEGKFIHAPKPGEQVRIESLSLAYWAKRFNGARRVIAPTDAERNGR